MDTGELRKTVSENMMECVIEEDGQGLAIAFKIVKT